MEQNANTGVPVAPVANNEQKNGNGLKITTAIACVVAICGIGFGVYGMIQSSQKDSQISALNSEMAGLKQSIEDLKNNNSNVSTKDNNDSSTQNPNQQETKKDYSSFIGTWRNDQTQNEITIKNVTDNEITFTWFLFRLGGIDNDTTIPFKDGKGVFFYQGYDDKNFDRNRTEDEKYTRKATLELTDSGVNVVIEDVNQVDASQKLLDNFSGSVYVGAGTYTHANKL